MPRWDFKCDCCGKVVEVTLAANEGCSFACPSCGGDMERQWAAPNFKLVGKGFHCNDYPKR